MDDHAHTHEHYVDRKDNGMSLLIGLIVLIILGFLFFYYGLPAIGNAFNRPAVQVPGQIDVNVNQPK